jgi:uncharacterized membrane protein
VTSDISTDAAGGELLEPAARVMLVAGPLAGFVVLLLATWALSGSDAAGFVASMAAGAFVGGGKLVILAGAVEEAPVGTWALAGLILYMDVATALVVMGGMPLLYRLPAAGRRLAAARIAGTRLLERYPWTRHATWLSLAGFVAVPFNGTGALVGAVLGRMLGLTRGSIFTATAFGSATGAVSLALAGDLWAERIDAVAGHPVLAVVAVLTVAALAILGSKWMFGESQDDDSKSTGA